MSYRAYIQHCIAPDCGAEFDLDARLFVCSRCGGLLDIERREKIDSAPLRELWQQRRASLDPRDRSGVWRFREFLPFPEDTQVVSLGEGNTPLLAINRSLLSNWPYESGRNLQPVARLTNSQNLLTVTPSLPVKSVRELIDYAKQNPDKLIYASPGNGTTIHLSAELFKQMTGTRMVHVPYKAITVAHTELIAGQVHVIFDNLTSITALVKAGRLRGIAVTGTTRAGPFPDLPTIAEAGVPGYDVTVWTGVIAPLGVPQAIITKLNTEINRACTSPALLEKFATFGNTCLGSTPAQFADLIKKETVKWADVVKRSGAKVD